MLIEYFGLDRRRESAAASPLEFIGDRNCRSVDEFPRELRLQIATPPSDERNRLNRSGEGSLLLLALIMAYLPPIFRGTRPCPCRVGGPRRGDIAK